MKLSNISSLVATLAASSVYALLARVTPAATYDMSVQPISHLHIVERDSTMGIPEVIPTDALVDEDNRSFATPAASPSPSASSESADTSSDAPESTSSASELANGEGTSAGIDLIVAVAAAAATTTDSGDDEFNALSVLSSALATFPPR